MPNTWMSSSWHTCNQCCTIPSQLNKWQWHSGTADMTAAIGKKEGIINLAFVPFGCAVLELSSKNFLELFLRR